MSSEKKRVVTSRERGRVQSLVMAVASLAMIGFGIYVVSAASNWIVLVLAIIFSLCTIVFMINNERVHHGEP